MKINNLKELKVELPDSLLAYKLLANAGLTDDVTRIVRATCKDLKLQDMKNAIFVAFSNCYGNQYQIIV